MKVHNISVDNINELGVFTNVMTSQQYHVMLTFHHKDGPFTSLQTPVDNAHSCYNDSITLPTVQDHMITPPVYYLQQVGFDCLLTIKSPTYPQISQSDVAKAVAVFDNRSGNSYCHIMPTSNSATQRLLSIINDVTMTLQVIAYDFAHSYTISSAPVRIPFIPSFVLSQQQIRLGSCDHSANIEVWGTVNQLNNLQVTTLYNAHHMYHVIVVGIS